MTNELIEKLNLILNYEISPLEKLTTEERKQRILAFKIDLTVNKYMELFQNVRDEMLNPDVDSIQKEILIKLLLECINLYSKFYENINMFPLEIQQIFKSDLKIKRVFLGIEQYLKSDIFAVAQFENELLYYLVFLNDPENELYINLCYSKIEKLNNDIIIGLKALDYDGNTRESKMNNQSLVNLFKEKANNMPREKN